MAVEDHPSWRTTDTTDPRIKEHPLYLDLLDISEHVRDCEHCRAILARILYASIKRRHSPNEDDL